MNALNQLQTLLRDLFQLDLADLDFGLYRLLRLKQGEVEAFLKEQLPRRVEDAFKSMAGEEQEALQKEVASLADRIRKEVSDEAVLPNGDVSAHYQDVKVKAAQELLHHYQEAREKLKSVQASEAQMAEVFNHLYSFFSRYYDSGDFIPRRRYGANETYAVPYRGEEVFFHWANRDQHYVKTAENFRDYSFTVETLSGPSRVRFALTEASVPPGNLKGDTRYFFPLPDEAVWDKDSQTLRLPFHYRLPTEKEVEKYGKNSRFQEAILQGAAPKILRAIPDANTHAALSTVVDQKEDQEVSLLLRRLRHFCRRNTSDYFVHKDLEGFLKRELEFYIKDQVLHLGDLEGDLEAKRRTVRVFRQLAEEMITFLAQIENVQKRLFEKRKFILRTEYLVPIKEVPRDLWKEVLSNKEQVQAWKELFAIEPRKDLFNKSGKVNEEFLKEHPTLVVNTAYFESEFKERVLASFKDLDEATDGLLIHGENYQALRLLERKFAGKIKCIYIDPPYNTGNDGFIYRDSYRHSSWLAMMWERLLAGCCLLQKDGVHLSSIGEDEFDRLEMILSQTFALRTVPFAWKSRAKPTNAGDAIYRPQVVAEFVMMNLRDSQTTFYPLPSGEDRNYPHQDRHGRYRTTTILTSNRGRYRRETMRFEIGGYTPPPEKRWKAGPDEIRELYETDHIGFGDDGEPYRKIYEGDEEALHMPLWTFLPEEITGTAESGKSDLSAILAKDHGLDSVKPKELIEIFLAAVVPQGTVLDYFAGSGTTGHAVISLNREDGGRRKFILVEMADYFDTVLLPRIQKVMYTPEWKDGKPARTPTKDEISRTPRLVKFLRLEGYDDALHNLVTENTLKQEEPRAKAHKKLLGENTYRLHYLVRLPLEASASMLNVEALEHPFDYKIEVLTDQGPKVETVDLVETFNYLYGLYVQRMETWVNKKDNRAYRAVKGKKGNGERIMIVWRDMAGLDPVVEREFLAGKLKDEGPFDEVLINGDSATPGVKSLDGLFKRLMEEEER